MFHTYDRAKSSKGENEKKQGGIDVRSMLIWDQFANDEGESELYSISKAYENAATDECWDIVGIRSND